jgi:hypothetical protein
VSNKDFAVPWAEFISSKALIAPKLCKVEKALDLGAIRLGGGVFPHGFQQNCLKLSYSIYILNPN